MVQPRGSSTAPVVSTGTRGEVFPSNSGQAFAEPLIDSVKAAAIVGIHPKTLQRYARCSLIPGIQIGGRWRFRASVIDAWIAHKYAS
jgi:hypothetical protein